MTRIAQWPGALWHQLKLEIRDIQSGRPDYWTLYRVTAEWLYRRFAPAAEAKVNKLWPELLAGRWELIESLRKIGHNSDRITPLTTLCFAELAQEFMAISEKSDILKLPTPKSVFYMLLSQRVLELC